MNIEVFFMRRSSSFNRAKGILFLFFALICGFVTIPIREAIKYYEGAHVSNYLQSGNTIINMDNGLLHYDAEKVQGFTVLLWVVIIIGIVFFLIGISYIVSSFYSAPNSDLDSEIVRKGSAFSCPSCGNVNDLWATKCRYCNAPLVTTPIHDKETEDNSVKLSANEWICPSCGRINQNYVGTCGCGTEKP